MAPRWPLNGPKTAPRRPKMTPRRPKMAQARPLKRRSRLDLVQKTTFEALKPIFFSRSQKMRAKMCYDPLKTGKSAKISQGLSENVDLDPQGTKMIWGGPTTLGVPGRGFEGFMKFRRLDL